MRALAFFVILLSACSGYDDLALLDVETIEPPEIETGGTLRIHGHGFPLGRAPEILLRGSIYRPGMRASRIDARLAGEVRSESLIEIPIVEELIDALGGRATVDGELRVGFRAADQRRDVFAAERVRVDFLPDTSSQLRADVDREGQSSPLPVSPSFGLELSREELGAVGVEVVSVDPDGLAARQGVKSGDTIVGLDGMSLYSRRDFLPDPSRTESTVLVARDGLRGVHALRWPHEAKERSAEPMAIGLFVLLGLLLGWLSPATLWLRTSPATVSLSAWLTGSSLIVIFAALLVFVSALHWTTMWILGLGTFAALFTLATRDRAGASSFAFAVTATVTVMLLARTASLSLIIAAQHPSVLRWYLFQSPASFFACAAYVYALGAVGARANYSASLYSAAAAVFGAALFLGGWPLAGSMGGIAAFAGKAAALMIAARAIEMSPKVAATCSGLGAGLALLGYVVDLASLFPQWSALSVGAVCALAVRALVPPLRREAAPVMTVSASPLVSKNP
ncbi:MAG: PDZ domain-containing protein [Polyangiales bacterium]